LISNEKFIERSAYVYTRTTQKKSERTTINQIHHGIDGKYPQIENPLIQSLKKQKFKSRYRFFAVLKVTTIPLPTKTPHHTMGNHSLHNQISMIAITTLPTSPKIQHMTRHHSMNPK
jgi:hypothetical protein